MKLGIDVSTYFEELAHGAKYFDGDKEVDPLNLFRANGVECMRIRVWVNPYGKNGEPYLAGTCDTDNFLKLAKLAQSKGYSIMLDIHYSDFWCDPAKQLIPKSWEHNDIDKLEKQVYNYTVDLLKTIKKNGIELGYIQVGNEITNGFLWPLGYLVKLPDDTRTNFHNFIKLLKAGIKGCRKVTPQTPLILHLERSYDQKIYDEFFTHMAEAGVDYDIIGYSYYPYWHGTFEQFYANVDMCKKFGKRQMVVELGYAFTLEDYVKCEHGGAHLVVSENSIDTFGFVKEYPMTPEGQAHFAEEFLKTAEAHGIEGVFWWEPLWIPGEGICWASEEAMKYMHFESKSSRNEWANQCMFDYNGKKLPVLDKFCVSKK